MASLLPSHFHENGIISSIRMNSRRFLLVSFSTVAEIGLSCSRILPESKATALQRIVNAVSTDLGDAVLRYRGIAQNPLHRSFIIVAKNTLVFILLQLHL